MASHRARGVADVRFDLSVMEIASLVILLFVAVDGWRLLIDSLLRGYV